MENDNELFERINDILAEYDFDPLETLASHVARLCNVDEKELYVARDKTHKAQARWLLWYSYRYMTGESYVKISERCGKVFNKRTIAAGVERMSHLIEREETWRNKWMVIKHIIKSKRTITESDDIDITIIVPRGMKDKIKLKIKENGR